MKKRLIFFLSVVTNIRPPPGGWRGLYVPLPFGGGFTVAAKKLQLDSKLQAGRGRRPLGPGSVVY